MIAVSRNKIALVSIVLLYILVIPFLIVERSLKKELNERQVKFKEMSALSDEYKTIKERIGNIESKSGAARVDGVAQAVDSIVASIGLKGKIKSIRVAGSKGMKGVMTEENAEVQIEKVTMNELVNLFYSIHDAPMTLAIKRALMKKSFENPELLDISMTVALLVRK